MSKNRFGKFWNFDPWRLQFWPEPKNDRNDFEMIFRELSNAAFRFSLRRPGAEIMGGRSNAPPSRRWKIQRPSRARVNKHIIRFFENFQNFGFYGHFCSFKNIFFFNFGGQNHKISKIRDSHLVELVILRLTCVLYAFPFNSLPFMDSQTIVTFGSEMRVVTSLKR